MNAVTWTFVGIVVAVVVIIALICMLVGLLSRHNSEAGVHVGYKQDALVQKAQANEMHNQELKAWNAMGKEANR